MRQTTAISVVMVVVSIGIFVWLATAGAGAVIIQPPPGALIENRLNFPVAGSIDDYSESRTANLHYWISIASVKGNNEPDLHWPKFYVKSGQFQGMLSDGGQNPFPDPQPMIILLLRVNDETNQRFTRWLQDGARTGAYSGLKVERSAIVTSVPIKFP